MVMDRSWQQGKPGAKDEEGMVKKKRGGGWMELELLSFAGHESDGDIATRGLLSVDCPLTAKRQCDTGEGAEMGSL